MSELVKPVVDIKMQRKVERAPAQRGSTRSAWLITKLIDAGYVSKPKSPNFRI